jgi:NAD+ kinase
MVGANRSQFCQSRPSPLAKILPELLSWFEKHNYSVMVDKETIVYTKWSEVVARTEMASRSLDLVVVLGGDGTLLSAARAVARAGIPVLGVNLGSLGFLTEVPLAELYPTLDAMERGACGLESRSMVNCELHRREPRFHYQALNDVVVSKSAARLNNFDSSL